MRIAWPAGLLCRRFLCVSLASIPAFLTTAADEGLRKSQTRTFDLQGAPPALHVSGNGLTDAHGNTVHLYGVNIASLEWSNQGEHMHEAFEQALHQWKATIIRLPLAQDRWFGKAPNQTDGGEAYRVLVDGLVDLCAKSGSYVDLDLHWSDTGVWVTEGGKLGQHPMPDEYSVSFWRDAATRYKNHPAVLFGLYNEPHDVSWDIWLNGGSVREKPPKHEPQRPAVVYTAVGLQALYDAVRSTGAGNVVTISGLDWGYDLRGVLEGHAVKGTNILYETHPYPFKKDWDRNFGDVSRSYPVFIGEWGGSAKDFEYGQRLMQYAHERGLSWTAWCFHPSAGPTLIKNWSFEPTAFGEFVRTNLASASH